jgi:hypothetical protein
MSDDVDDRLNEIDNAIRVIIEGESHIIKGILSVDSTMKEILTIVKELKENSLRFV